MRLHVPAVHGVRFQADKIAPRTVPSWYNKMSMWVLLGLISVLISNTAAKDQGTYTTRYDHIDLERILSSRRLVNNYVDCLMGRKRCTPEGSELKRILPDALASDCMKCTQKQKDGAVKVILRLQKDYPKQFQELLKHWDPAGEHFKRLEATIKNRKNSPES